MKNTVLTLQQAKNENRKITMLTAYDYSTARLIDEAGVNMILVGDSLGNVMLGYEDTVSVTMEDMIHHGAAVARGAKNAMVVVDMPFMSYQTSVYDAVVNAGRLMKEARANAVKLEGGVEVAEQIKAIVAAGIPVVAHIGLTPQSINAFGGHKVQGKNASMAKAMIDDAIAVYKAGARVLLLEAVPEEVASFIHKLLPIPVYGIGAGSHVDGQLIIYADMVGYYDDFTPKFVKKYANVGEVLQGAFETFVKEVKDGTFPEDAKHAYKIDPDVEAEVETWIK